MTETQTPVIYQIDVTDIRGVTTSLSKYRGKVLLIVNTASKCGFTPQYAGLQALHDKYSSQGLVVLGFPCNQFGGQEPGNESEVEQFCTANFRISFPLFSKIEVNGQGTHPLYQLLKRQASGWLGTRSIKWNFTKFLVSRSGQVVGRFGPQTAPEKLASNIEQLLQEPAETH